MNVETLNDDDDNIAAKTISTICTIYCRHYSAMLGRLYYGFNVGTYHLIRFDLEGGVLISSFFLIRASSLSFIFFSHPLFSLFVLYGVNLASEKTSIPDIFAPLLLQEEDHRTNHPRTALFTHLPRTTRLLSNIPSIPCAHPSSCSSTTAKSPQLNSSQKYFQPDKQVYFRIYKKIHNVGLNF